MTSACGVCEIHRNSGFADLVAWESERWILRHHASPAPMAGWFLLDTKRHVPSAADFHADEEGEFAVVLGAAMRAIRSAVDVPRVYVIMYGEGAQHLHAHLIPRDPSQVGTAAWEVADWYRAVETGKRTPAQASDIARAVKRVSDGMRSTLRL